MEFINVGLLKKPANWLIVATMFLLGSFALHFLLQLIHGRDFLLFQKHPSRAV
jgi:hypothetical protein